MAVTDDIESIVASSLTIFGWREGEALTQVALASLNLGADAIIVEIGVFMGRSSVLLAGPRRLRGNGKVHCVDPFDCSGDAFSVPHYVDALKATGSTSLEAVFRQNISRLDLVPWIEVHKGLSRDVAASWSQSIDLLLLDGDQSQQGAREDYEAWVTFLKPGGTIILGNVHDHPSEGHDGNSRLAAQELVPPRYAAIRRFGATAFAIKVS